jgi:hypothetical protein
MGLLLTLLGAGLLWGLLLLGAVSDLASRVSGMLTLLLVSFAFVAVLLNHSHISSTARYERRPEGRVNSGPPVDSEFGVAP